MTKEAINKLSDVCKQHLEGSVFVANTSKNPAAREEIRLQIKGYCQCLKDCGILTENERRAINNYYRSKIETVF